MNLKCFILFACDGSLAGLAHSHQESLQHVTEMMSISYGLNDKLMVNAVTVPVKALERCQM